MVPENLESKYMRHNADASTEGLFILNPGGNIVHMNERVLSFAEDEQERLMGKNFISIFPEKERSRISSKFMGMLDGKSVKFTISKYEYGRRHIFEVNINPVTKNRRILMFVGTIRNVTYIKKMETERKKMVIREQNFRESVAHHFFNPLAIARGYLQLVVEKTSDGEEKRKLESSINAIGRVESVVKNVIQYGDVRE